MKTVRVNVIVSDLTKPGEDGLWLLQQIRRLKSEHGRSIPAIAVTAHRERYAASRLIELGFEAFLTKPVDPIDLASTVASPGADRRPWIYGGCALISLTGTLGSPSFEQRLSSALPGGLLDRRPRQPENWCNPVP